MSQSLAQSEAYVLYQGEGSATWQQSPQAEPVFGCDELPDGPCAPVGFRRYQVVLRTDTFTTGPGNTTVSFIPYIQTVGGARLFDHNRVGDPLGSYALTAQNNWTVSDDAAACPGPTPTARLTATFATRVGGEGGERRECQHEGHHNGRGGEEQSHRSGAARPRLSQAMEWVLHRRDDAAGLGLLCTPGLLDLQGAPGVGLPVCVEARGVHPWWTNEQGFPFRRPG